MSGSRGEGALSKVRPGKSAERGRAAAQDTA